MSHRIIALLVIVAALTVVGTATAAGGWWHQSASSYDCQGAPTVGVICKAGGYTIMINNKTAVGVFYGTGSRPTPIWSCKSNRPMYACTDFRP